MRFCYIQPVSRFSVTTWQLCDSFFWQLSRTTPGCFLFSSDAYPRLSHKTVVTFHLKVFFNLSEKYPDLSFSLIPACIAINIKFCRTNFFFNQFQTLLKTTTAGCEFRANWFTSQLASAVIAQRVPIRFSKVVDNSDYTYNILSNFEMLEKTKT